MPTTTEEDLRDARLQDTWVEEQLRDVRGKSSTLCDAEYGFRDDNHSLVFHFYPPGYAADSSVDWKNWTDFRDRLEKALIENFDIQHIEAGYVNELRSFYLIVKPRPRVADINALIARFFEVLEA